MDEFTTLCRELQAKLAAGFKPFLGWCERLHTSVSEHDKAACLADFVGLYNEACLGNETLTIMRVVVNSLIRAIIRAPGAANLHAAARAALALEPLSDLARHIVCPIEPSFSLFLLSNNPFVYVDASTDPTQPAIIRRACKVVDTLRFSEPLSCDLERLDGLAQNPRTRSDTYLMAVRKVTALLRTALDAAEPIRISDPAQKILWWLRWLADRLPLHEPNTLAAAALVRDVQALKKFKFKNKQAGLGKRDKAAADIKALLAQVLETLEQRVLDGCQPEPLRPRYRLDPVAVLELSASTDGAAHEALDAKLKAFKRRSPSPGAGSSVGVSGFQPVLLQPKVLHPPPVIDDCINTVDYYEGNALCCVAQVRLQVDPLINRVLRTEADAHQAATETLTSEDYGNFYVAKDKLVWVVKNARGDDLPLVLNFSDITNYTAGPVAKNSDVFYLTFHTNQSFTFFPFREGEVVHDLVPLLGLMNHLKKPFQEEHRIQDILQSNLHVSRTKALHEITREIVDKETKPWINAAHKLLDLFDTLASEARPQSVRNMELLFQSCRLNRDVTKETVNLVQKYWSDASKTVTEIGRVKILAIVERILDRSIFSRHDKLFKTLFEWLSRSEQTLDAARNPLVAKIMVRIRKRADIIKNCNVTTITSKKHEFREYLPAFQKQIRQLKRYSH